MKKKWYSIIFMVTFLLAACAFSNKGAPDNAVAGSSEVNTSDVSEREAGILEKQNKEHQEAVIINQTQTETAEQNDLNKESNGTDISDETKPQIKPLDKEEKVSEEKAPEDKIEIDGYQYVSVMDETKFQHLINVAKKYDSKLYAVPNTDLFAIIKSGEPILYKSTGVTSVPVNRVSLLKDVFSGEGFLYKGIPENIDFVKNTGAKVTVEFSQYEAYSIFLKDGWIYVSW
ncbi:hypothetical protein [Cytobacillus sp. FSL H8-0458]|uniref:hypothetical protein n=1 Tax=Cytobacillus sp. FSL H8-0458 TaxID=2975346 RepID=UPI0030F810CA